MMPPRVVGTVPRADSVGVGADTRIAIVFSEKLDGESFKNRIAVYPPVPFERVAVRGERVEISFAEPLPDTTICVLLRKGYRDRHRENEGTVRNDFEFCFATVDSIEAGRIEGAVLFKDKPDSTAAVKLFEIRSDSTLDVQRHVESRIAFAAPDGRFEFRALPARGSRYLLFAFRDANGDGRFAIGTETSALLPDTIVLSRQLPSRGDVRITIVDPNEPASVTGTIENRTAFRTRPFIRLEPGKSGIRAIATAADSTGAFMLRNVPPGSYRFAAFIDLAPDSLCGSYRSPADTTVTLNEPCVQLPDSLVLAPGEARNLGVIVLP